MTFSIILLIILIFTNLFLWFLFFRKLKTTYNPESLLINIRDEVNKLLIEINREADRDITIIEERTKQLKNLIEEADKKIVLNNEIIQKSNVEKEVLNQLNQYSSIGKNSNQKESIEKPYSLLNEYKKNSSMDSSLMESKQEEENLDLFNTTEKALTKEEPIHITFSSDPIVPKLNIKQEIIRMAKEGLSSEIIATKLNVSVREVELIIDISI